MKLAMKEITKIVLLAAATAGALSCTEMARASSAKASPAKDEGEWVIIRLDSSHLEQSSSQR